MEDNMNRRKVILAATAGSVILVAAGLGLAEHYELFEDDDDDDEGDSLVKSMGATKVSLQQGLAASEQEGQPISGKFEVEDGKFQLSVYTMKDGKFSEVLVDHLTAKVAKVEPITSGNDLSEAKSQSAAMAAAKLSLKDAVDKALAGNGDFRAVGVIPSVTDGHPAAAVVLVKGSEYKTMVLPLE
jgi:hypothetical protein